MRGTLSLSLALCCSILLLSQAGCDGCPKGYQSVDGECVPRPKPSDETPDASEPGSHKNNVRETDAGSDAQTGETATDAMTMPPTAGQNAKEMPEAQPEGGAGGRSKPQVKPNESVCSSHAGERFCDAAGALYTCTDEGEIAAQVACETRELCELGRDSGECGRCVPNEARCSDQRLERCDDSGRAFDSVTVCVAPDRCDASSATCLFADRLPNQLMLDTWAKQQGLHWEGQVWLAADATGDGRSDMINVFADMDKLIYLDVHAAGSGFFNFEMWTAREGESKDLDFWAAADFNGDGRADVARIFSDGAGNSAIDVYVSTGSSFRLEHWSTAAGGLWEGQVWLAGDFSGDGKGDLAVIFAEQEGVSVDVHTSDGAAFSSTHWLVRDDKFNAAHKWVAGDFNGDKRVDLARVFGDSSGKVAADAYVSSESTFTRERWINGQGSYWDAQLWFAGDFTGDGLADLGNVYADGTYASIDVRPSTGKAFGFERWTNRLGNMTAGQSWVAGDFNGNQKADFGVVYGDNGMITIEVQLH